MRGPDDRDPLGDAGEQAQQQRRRKAQQPVGGPARDADREHQGQLARAPTGPRRVSTSFHASRQPPRRDAGTNASAYRCRRACSTSQKNTSAIRVTSETTSSATVSPACDHLARLGRRRRLELHPDGVDQRLDARLEGLWPETVGPAAGPRRARPAAPSRARRPGAAPLAVPGPRATPRRPRTQRRRAGSWRHAPAEARLRTQPTNGSSADASRIARNSRIRTLAARKARKPIPRTIPTPRAAPMPRAVQMSVSRRTGDIIRNPPASGHAAVHRRACSNLAH